jgi:hypothetical protein
LVYICEWITMMIVAIWGWWAKTFNWQRSEQRCIRWSAWEV